MESLGLTMKELYEVEFFEYINFQNGVKTLPKELQLKRYETFEESRIKKINDIKQVNND